MWPFVFCVFPTDCELPPCSELFLPGLSDDVALGHLYSQFKWLEAKHVTPYYLTYLWRC